MRVNCLIRFTESVLFGVSERDKLLLLLVIQSRGILRFLDSLPLLQADQLLEIHLIGGLEVGVTISHSIVLLPLLLLMWLVWLLSFTITLSSSVVADCWEQLIGDGVGVTVFGGRILKHPFYKFYSRSKWAH